MSLPTTEEPLPTDAIDAIEIVRTACGSGLKESKDNPERQQWFVLKPR